MDLRQIRYFLAVVDHGSFTPAAAALYIAQPSLSHAIRALERNLGTDLFIRHSKGIALTSTGKALLGPARQIVRDFDVAHDAVSHVLGLEGGSLSLVAAAWIIVNPLSELIGQLRQQHSRVSCELVEPADDRELISLVSEGTCELGFLYTPPGGAESLHHQGLDYLALGKHEYRLVAPAGYPLAAGAVPWVQLTDLPWVTPPPGGPVRDFVMALFEEAGVTVKPMVTTATRDALLPLVLAGAGITLLPLDQARDAEGRGAVVRPLIPPLRRPYGVVSRTGVMSVAANTFRDMAVRAHLHLGEGTYIQPL